MTITLVGTPINPVTTTGSYTINGTGNLLTVLVDTGAQGTITSVTDTNSKVTWAGAKDTGGSFGPAGPSDVEIWHGTTTSTGATTVTLTFSGSSTGIEFVVWEWHSSLASPTWSFVVGSTASQTNGATSTVTWPSLTSAASGDQVYVGICSSYAAATTGSTAGFTYATTANSNVDVYETGLAGTTAYQPTCPNGGTANWYAPAAIYKAVGSAVAFVAPGATFVGQGSTPDGITGTASSPTTNQAIRRGGFY